MTLLGQTQRFAYDTVGNFTSKAGVAYAGYGAGRGTAGTRTPRRRSAGWPTPTTAWGG